MSGRTLATRFTRLVGCRLPVVQTGMGWVAGPALAAATSSAGGLGILAAATMDDEQLQRALRSVADTTTAPFGVNYRPDQAGLDRRVDWALAAGARLISFAGPPTAATVARAHAAGVLVMPTVGAPRHAVKMLDRGVDAVIAQGAEGGGHTGSIPTTLLLPAVVDAVGDSIPVLGAGGFFDGRGLAAALAFGADGIAMGTRFLLTAESRAHPDAIARYHAAGLDDTVVTTAIDGAPQRVISTPLVAGLTGRAWRRLPAAAGAARAFARTTGTRSRDLLREARGLRRDEGRGIVATMLAAQAPMLTRSGVTNGDVDHGILPSGQATGVLTDTPTVADLLARIEAEARTALDRLACTDPEPETPQS